LFGGNPSSFDKTAENQGEFLNNRQNTLSRQMSSIRLAKKKRHIIESHVYTKLCTNFQALPVTAAYMAETLG
jgi:hypothetical protein